MTSCISAPELTDDTLLAYLDGEADQHVALHLRQCPHCRERARHLARFQDRLTTQLYRLDCPSPAQLGEYTLEMLSHKETKAVALHLTECPHCAQEVAQLKTFLQDLAPEPDPNLIDRLRERTRVLIADLVRRGTTGRQPRQPVLAPAFAGVRGEETVPQGYEAEDIRVSIESQPDASHPGRWTILGLVLGFDAGTTAVAHLWQEGRWLASQPVSDAGDFYLGNVAPAEYDLILSAGPIEVHIRDVEVGRGARRHDRSEPDQPVDQPAGD